MVAPRTRSALDDGTIAGAGRGTGRAVIRHEAPRTCGLGAEIAATIMERVFYHLEAPIERVTGFDTPMPLLKMEGHYMPGLERVMGAIRRAMTA